MEKYVVVYNNNDYPDNGGGEDYKLYDDEESMISDINVKLRNPLMEVLFCAEISKVIEIEAVEVVTKFKIKE